MLGVRLTVEAEDRLARHAREAGRAKSALVRDWIMEKLDEKEVDEVIRRAARLHADTDTRMDKARAAALSTAHLQWLDTEDGGYDWGPDGPPDPL